MRQSPRRSAFAGRIFPALYEGHSPQTTRLTVSEQRTAIHTADDVAFERLAGKDETVSKPTVNDAKNLCTWLVAFQGATTGVDEIER